MEKFLPSIRFMHLVMRFTLSIHSPHLCYVTNPHMSCFMTHRPLMLTFAHSGVGFTRTYETMRITNFLHTAFLVCLLDIVLNRRVFNVLSGLPNEFLLLGMLGLMKPPLYLSTTLWLLGYICSLSPTFTMHRSVLLYHEPSP